MKDEHCDQSRAEEIVTVAPWKKNKYLGGHRSENCSREGIERLGECLC